MRGSLVAVTVIVILIAVAIFFTYSGGFQKYTPELKKIRMGTLQGGISTLDVVEKTSMGKNYGVKVEVIRFAKTPDILAALAKNEIDGAIIPAEMAAKLIEKGIGLRIIAVDMMQNQAIISMKEGVKSPEDLKGRIVAAVVPSGTYKMFKAYMRTVYGIEVVESTQPVQGRIAVVNVPPGSILVALEKGDVDAAVIWEPFVSKALVRGAHIVADYQSLWRKSGAKGDPVMLVWVVTEKFASENPKLARILAQLQNQAAKTWVRDKNLVENILMGPLYRLSSKEAETLYERVVINTRLLDKSLVESIREEWKIAWQGGYLPENPDKIPDSVFLVLGAG